MGTTANNNWPTPVASDLVKDGWEAIKDLGDAIDTTLGVYAPSTSGLTLINTTSFSGVSSQSVNDVFSATYDNYRIVFDAAKSTSSNVRLRLRVAGADDTSSNYGIQWIYVSGTTLAQYQANTNGFDITSSDTQNQVTSLDIFAPFSNAKNTTLTGLTLTGIYGTNPQVSTNFLRFSGNTSFTGISLIANAGNITGKVSIYGYNL